jgi:RNA polymerase sigma-70 factor (ECF subfamily)
MTEARGTPEPVREDGALVAAARAGDAEAFRILYERYSPAVLGFLSSRLGDHALAEDALQETFCKAHRALDRYDAARPFGPWIGAIAENAGHDQERRRKVRAMRSIGAEDQPLDATVDHIRVVTRREREEIVRTALTALPPDPRSVLLLRYQSGLTQREVAEKLGCSLRTAQTREETALELLLSLLDTRRKKTTTSGKEAAP